MTFIGSISCPPILRSSLCVMTIIRIWKVFCLDVTLGIPFHSHLMCSGGVIHVVATWHAPSGGCLCLFRGAFGFPTSFQFSKIDFLKNFSLFPSSSSPFRLSPFSHFYAFSKLFNLCVVRSSKLETGLSSNDDPIKAEMDTTTSNQREIKSFHALKEECALDTDTPFRFRDRFQVLKGFRVCLPREREKAYHFSPGEVCFYEAAFHCGLRFPVLPFIMELLSHFNIAPRQLMPNSWRIVVSYMEI